MLQHSLRSYSPAATAEHFLHPSQPLLFHGQKSQAGVNRNGAQAERRVGSGASRLSGLCLPLEQNSAVAILGEGAATGWELKGFLPPREYVSISEDPGSVLKHRWHGTKESQYGGFLMDRKRRSPGWACCVIGEQAEHRTSYFTCFSEHTMNFSAHPDYH